MTSRSWAASACLCFQCGLDVQKKIPICLAGGGRAGGDAHAAAAGDGAYLGVRGGPARALPDAAAGGRAGARRHAPVRAGDQGRPAAGAAHSIYTHNTMPQHPSAPVHPCAPPCACPSWRPGPACCRWAAACIHTARIGGLVIRQVNQLSAILPFPGVVSWSWHSCP